MRLPNLTCGRYLSLAFCTGLALVYGAVPVQASDEYPRDNAADARPSRQPEETIELSIRSSPDSAFRSVIQIHSRLWSRWLRDVKLTTHPADRYPSYDTAELAVHSPNGTLTYRINRDLTLSNGTETKRIPDKMDMALGQITKTLKQAHFGKLVDWPAASRLLPRGSSFTITDLETGLSFRGQRRAGSSHADVQPLTKQDSAVMKHIYGGKWSWNRRAVLVETRDGAVAGSMHGMPHGGDGIPGNDFDGHFCIHYKGSVTHGSSHLDPAHQVMIHKAAGELEAYHKSLAAAQVAELFLLSSQQKDALITGVLLHPESHNREFLIREWQDPDLKMARLLDEESIKPSEAQEKEDLTVQLRTRVSIWREGARPQALWLRWTFCRTAPDEAWFIQNVEPEGAVR